MNHKLISLDNFVSKNKNMTNNPLIMNIQRGVDFKSVVSNVCELTETPLARTVVLAMDEFTMSYCVNNTITYVDTIKDYVTLGMCKRALITKNGKVISSGNTMNVDILVDKMVSDMSQYDTIILSSINVMSEELLNGLLLLFGRTKNVVLIGDSYIPDFINNDGYITKLLSTSMYRIAGPLTSTNSLVKMTSRDIIMFSNRLYLHQLHLEEHVLFKKTNSVDIMYNNGNTDNILRTNFNQPDNTGLIIVDNVTDVIQATELYRSSKMGIFDNKLKVNDILMSYNWKYYNDKITGVRTVVDPGTKMVVNKIGPTQYDETVIEVIFLRNGIYYTIDILVNLDYLEAILNGEFDKATDIMDNKPNDTSLHVFYGYASTIKYVIGKTSDVGIIIHDFNFNADRRMLYAKLLPIQKQLKIVLNDLNNEWG